MTPGLAYLCGEYPRATDTFIQREVRGLRERGWRVETISVRRPHVREQGSEEQAGERERTYYLLPSSPWRLLGAHLRAACRSPRRYLSSLRLALVVRAPGIKSFLLQCAYFLEAGLVSDRMRKENLSHIHNHSPDAGGYVAMMASEMGGTTFSMTLHGFAAFSEPTRWRLREKLSRCLFSICVSQFGRGQAMLWSAPEDWEKFELVHCGLDGGQRVRKKHRGAGSTLVYAGRLDHVKGLPLLIRAVGQLRESGERVTLELIGDGPERERIRQLVADEGLQQVVRMPGYLSQRELQGVFEAADIFVMTSFAEGIPVVLMEAMAAGVPVIAPRIAGIPELVEHQVSGWLYSCGDVDELVSALRHLLRDGELREKLAESGRLAVLESFDRQKECERLDSIFRRRIRSGSASPIEKMRKKQGGFEDGRDAVSTRGDLRTTETIS